MHTHSLVHRHSHTVSSMSAASQQQVSVNRGHLCDGPHSHPPLLLRLWPPLLGKDWPWRASRQPASQLFIHTTKTQNSFNQNASALASWPLSISLSLSLAMPFFSLLVAPNTSGVCFSTPKYQCLSFLCIPISLRSQLFFIPKATWGN